jgi:hypothetical protein
MKYMDVFFYASMISALVFSGCAGPISPFGGVEVWSGDGQSIVYKTAPVPTSEFSFLPKRQVLHQESDLSIKFKLDRLKNNRSQIKVTYNNKDVTNTFLKSAKLHRENGTSVQYVFNKLKLKPDRSHKIDIYWNSNSNEAYSRISYLPPVCSINDDFALVSTKPFKPKNEVIRAIKTIATENQINPSLLAGLIAQESSFNQTRVSYAKAVGLTQITPIAEEEIKKLRPDWPSDPRINELNFFSIRTLILNNHLNRNQDWRLNPAQAIEGGALYLNYLINYWSTVENKTLLALNKTSLTSVVLASYNSGPARVKNKIKTDGELWLENVGLKEAYKYVNSVSSYCYHFSEIE